MLGGQAVGLDLDEVGRALAGGSDAAGHVGADGEHEIGHRLLVFLGLDLNAGGAVGKQEDRVVGGGVAVDGAHIEALVDRRGEHLLQVGGIGLGVSRHVDEHRRHVGVDHARALGHRADLHRAGGELQLIGALLADGIGGHDGVGSLGAVLLGELGGNDLADALEHLVDRKSLADDAGGADEHFVLAEAEQLFRLALNGAGILDALRAGGGVGVAGVDDDGAGLAVLEDLTVENDGSGAELIGSEHRGAGRLGLGVEDGHIGLLGLAALHADVHSARGKALRGGDAAAFDHFVFHSVVLLFLFLLYIKSVPYGYIGGIMRPVVSGRPMIRFMFWMAWPAAPLPMLSITEETIRRWVRLSKVGVISQKLVP